MTVKSDGWKYPNPKYYYSDVDGEWVSIYRTAKLKVTVTYPETYKNLCIAVGGRTTVDSTTKNSDFWDGKTTFAKTSYYSKSDKSVCHVMRVVEGPAKVTDVSVTSKKAKNITVKWKKNTKAKGYIIEYSTDKEFKKDVKTKKIAVKAVTVKK